MLGSYGEKEHHSPYLHGNQSPHVMLTGKCHEDKGQSFMSLLFRLEKASWRKWFKAEILRMSKSYQSEFITYIKISYMVGTGF